MGVEALRPSGAEDDDGSLHHPMFQRATADGPHLGAVVVHEHPRATVARRTPGDANDGGEGGAPPRAHGFGGCSEHVHAGR